MLRAGCCMTNKGAEHPISIFARYVYTVFWMSRSFTVRTATDFLSHGHHGVRVLPDMLREVGHLIRIAGHAAGLRSTRLFQNVSRKVLRRIIAEYYL